VIDKEKFDSFYVPVYGPSSQELRDITEEDGSFSIREMRVHGSTTDLSGAASTPKQVHERYESCVWTDDRATFQRCDG